MRRFLAAHAVGAAFGGVIQPRLLHHAAAALDHFDLPLDLIVQRVADEAEAVHVLHFRLGAVHLRTLQHDGDVRVAAQRTLFHVAIAHARVQKDFLELRQILVGLFGRAQIGLADDFNQRRPAAVQVDVGAIGRVGKAVMHALAGVLFHVQPRDADAARAALAVADVEPAVLRQRLVELRDLVALRRVRIEVILPREDALFIHRAMQRGGREHGKLHRLAVQHRQRTRQPQADGAAMRIGLATVAINAAAERLRLRQELHMHFKPDDGLILREDVRSDQGCSTHSISLSCGKEGSASWGVVQLRKVTVSMPLSLVTSIPGPSIGISLSPSTQAACSRKSDGSPTSSE